MSQRISDVHRYAFSVDAFRVGILPASAFVLIHLFVEPRWQANFSPILDTALVLGGCAVIGYVAGVLIWLIRAEKPSSRIAERERIT